MNDAFFATDILCL